MSATAAPGPNAVRRDPAQSATLLLGLAAVLLGSATYIGAVLATAWVVFVALPVLISGWAGWRAARRFGLIPGLLAGPIVAGSLAVAIKLSGYSTGGSVARSPLFAGILGAMAMAFLARSWAGSFALLVAAQVCAGATINAWAFHVGSVVAAVVLSVQAMTASEYARRRWERRAPLARGLVGTALIGGLAFGVAQSLRPAPADPDAQQEIQIQPPIQLPSLSGRGVAILLLVLCLVLVLILIFRATVRRRKVAALRRRLSGSDPAQAVAGAWAWTLAVLRARGVPIELSFSSDSLDDLAPTLPYQAAVPLRELAGLVTYAAFAAQPKVSIGAVSTAWTLADQVVAGYDAALPWPRRIRMALR